MQKTNQETMKETETIINSQVRDSGGKIIFGDNTLCSQFLRDYIPLPYLKDYSNEELLDKADEISRVMLINKLQTPEDVEKFRRILPQKLEEILKETPKHLLDIIGNVLLAFLLKENVPVEEAEDLAGKVREKKMGMLFENMQKMDIQEERRKTAEQRMRAEVAEQKVEEAEQKVEKAEQKVEKAEQKAEEATQKLESSIRLFVESCQNEGLAQEDTVTKLVMIYQMDMELAEKKRMQYWK